MFAVVLASKAAYPIAVLFAPVVFILMAFKPTAVLLLAVVVSLKACNPIATLLDPVVIAVPASLPIAVLFVPVVNASAAPLPTFTLVSVNPIPNLPAVIATPTLMFCRNVAFVLVLIFSVDATPVKSAPLPTN